MGRKGSYEIVSLGGKLNRKTRELWRRVEIDAFEDDPRHVLGGVPRWGRMPDTEFFLLYSGDKPVGRAAVALGQGWLSSDKKQDNVGFIQWFVIHPLHRRLAGNLIGHCLSHLKRWGAEGVIVRDQLFPAMAAEEYEDLVDLIGGVEGHGEDFVDFLISHKALLFCQRDQLINFLLMLR